MRTAMLTMLILWIVLASSTFGRPVHAPEAANATDTDILELFSGNARFIDRMDKEHPGLLKAIANKAQVPGFVFIGCSDSRASEGTLFDALPGKLFVQRNIGNHYVDSDSNAKAVLTYGVSHLGVKHIIVMGHYGCGAVSAAITSPISPHDGSDPVQRWILPIKEVYATSNRSEVVELRWKNREKSPIPAPAINDPGYRALVEENIKASLRQLQKAELFFDDRSSKFHEDSNLSPNPKARANPEDLAEKEPENDAESRVFLHGWVYDMETGRVMDLGISTAV